MIGKTLTSPLTQEYNKVLIYFNDTNDRKDFDITSLTQEYNKVLIFNDTNDRNLHRDNHL